MSTATVTDIGKALEERITAIIASGHLSYEEEDQDVVQECARRYIDNLHEKYVRDANHNVETFAKVRQEVSERLRERVTSLIAEHSTELPPDWSPELLAASFMVNGGRVTNGAATFDQHKNYAEMMDKMIAGDIQTAAMHRQAMRDIQAAGVTTLNELASKLAGLM